MNTDHEGRIVEYFLSLSDSPDQLLEQHFRVIFRNLSTSTRAKYLDNALGLLDAAKTRDGWYWLLVELVGVHNVAGQDLVRKGIRDGDTRALGVSNALQCVGLNEAEALLPNLLPVFEQLHQEGLRGSYSRGGIDRAWTYTYLALSFPALDLWPPLLAFLSDPVVIAGTKRSACKLLASRIADVPDGFRADVQNAASSAMATPPVDLGFVDAFVPAIGGAFHELYLEALPANSEARTKTLMNLLLGGEAMRSDAVDYLSRRPGGEDTLLAICQDGNAIVAVNAKRALARRVRDDKGIAPEYVSALMAMLDDGAPRTAKHILAGLAGSVPCQSRLAPIVAMLADYPSAVIKRMAETLTCPAAT